MAPEVTALAECHECLAGHLPQRLSRHIPLVVHVQLVRRGPAGLARPAVALKDGQSLALPAGIAELLAIRRHRASLVFHAALRAAWVSCGQALSPAAGVRVVPSHATRVQRKVYDAHQNECDRRYQYLRIGFVLHEHLCLAQRTRPCVPERVGDEIEFGHLSVGSLHDASAPRGVTAGPAASASAGARRAPR
jgi:hypothetical protein